jgi:hypothetical protein
MSANSPGSATMARALAACSATVRGHALRVAAIGLAALAALGACAPTAPSTPASITIFGEQHDQPDQQRQVAQAVRSLAAAGRLGAVVLGGDRRAVAALRHDPRLRPYIGLAVERFLTVPDPRLAVLRDSPRLFRSVRVRVTGPTAAGR